MKSIDNLREYVCSAPMPSMTNMARAIVVGMTDEIEREVKELTDERDLLKRQWEAGVDFDQRLEACVDKREDVTLWGVDYTPLPVDADGVPIHVGDAMEADDGTTFEVEHISLYQWGWRCVGEGTDRSGVTCTAHAIPDGCRHHHAQTVEDVLADVADRAANLTGSYHEGGMNGDEYMDSMSALVTEYAAKLMLKED